MIIHLPIGRELIDRIILNVFGYLEIICPSCNINVDNDVFENMFYEEFHNEVEHSTV